MTARHLFRRIIPSQRGGVLLVMLVILVIGLASVFVSSLSSSAVKNRRDQMTADVLAQAKEALIGYAITYGDTHTSPPQVHGYLPCPDIDASNGEGSSKLSCGSRDVSTIGRLPWKTLKLPVLHDGNGECLWYAVSGTYKNNSKTHLMNWDTRGLLAIHDSNNGAVADDVVAVIFAPGAVLGGQNRSADGSAPVCGGNYTAGNYLDSDGTLNNAAVSATANAITQFRLSSSEQINDRLIYITRQDIWNTMLKRNDFMPTLAAMTQKAAECIADYGRRNNAGAFDKRLPWSGRLRSPTDDYWTDSNYDDEDGRLAGRLPYRVNTSDGNTNNQIFSPYYQLASDGDDCPGVAGWPSYYPWWSNWKEQLFYAVARNFRPDSGFTSCGTCLHVNGSGYYAAVVMFAGQPLAGQTRSTTSDRLDFSNYLEGRNYSNGANFYGNSNYESATPDSSFNDVLYCINPDLSVSPC